MDITSGLVLGVYWSQDLELINLRLCIYPFLLRHEAERLEQEAKGRLERQRISDEAEAERSRRVLLELQANSAAVESTGQAKAEAQSRAEASKIEGEAAVEQAKLSTAAATIEAVGSLSDKLQCRLILVVVNLFKAALWYILFVYHISTVILRR